MKERVEKWLRDNREAFGSGDDYPAEFHRHDLFSLVGPRSKVAILTPQGQMKVGTVMIFTPGSHGACHEVGSSGARPFLVDAKNCIWCDSAPRRLEMARYAIRRIVRRSITEI